MNPKIFKIKMEHWLDSSAYIQAHISELSDEERTAVDFLLNAWRTQDFSPSLSDKARTYIDILVSNDELHGNRPELKTKIQRFRGVASNIYTVSAEDFNQFRTELCLRFGVNPPEHRTQSQQPDSSQNSQTGEQNRPQNPQSGQQNQPQNQQNRQSQSQTPPPPPPPQGQARFMIDSAGIDILSARGSVLRASCISIPEGSDLLRPFIRYSTTVVGSRWKITCRLINSDGKEVKIMVQEIAAQAANGRLDLEPFADCYNLPAGNYNLLIYVNGSLRSESSLTISPSNRTFKHPVTVNILDIVLCDAKGNPNATRVLSTTQFIAPKIELSSSALSAQSQTLSVWIYNPMGQLMRGKNSPPRMSFTQEVNFAQNATITLQPWGDRGGRYFAMQGEWKITIQTESGATATQVFLVSRPQSSAPDIDITNVDFFTRLSAADTSRDKFAPAPAPGTDTICPHIQFSRNTSVNVVEISFTIYSIDPESGQPTYIYDSMPMNYNIESASDKLLEPANIPYLEFSEGEYGISFRVNGVDTPIHKFEVKEHKPFHWGPFIAIILTILSFILGIFVF